MHDKQLSLGAYRFFSFLVIILAAYCAFLFQSNWEAVKSLGFSGLFVPDAVGLELTVDLAWTSDWHALPNLTTLIGVVLLYGPVRVFGGWAVTAVNVLLLWCASQVFVGSVSLLFETQKARHVALVATALVSSNVYIIEILQFPNKEIPLLLLSNLVVYFALVRGGMPLAILFALLGYPFRDGFAIILLLALALVFCWESIGRTPARIALFALPVLMTLVEIRALAGVDPAVARNVEIGEYIAGDKFESFGFLFSYPIRLAGNVLNFGLRPQLANVFGDIHLLTIGYWQFGVVLLAGLLWAGSRVFSRDASGTKVALILVVSIFSISYGSFVQPRYMMPLMFWLSFGALESRASRWISLVTCMIGPLVFLELGGLPPLAGD